MRRLGASKARRRNKAGRPMPGVSGRLSYAAALASQRQLAPVGGRGLSLGCSPLVLNSTRMFHEVESTSTCRPDGAVPPAIRSEGPSRSSRRRRSNQGPEHATSTVPARRARPLARSCRRTAVRASELPTRPLGRAATVAKFALFLAPSRIAERASVDLAASRANVALAHVWCAHVDGEPETIAQRLGARKQHRPGAVHT